MEGEEKGESGGKDMFLKKLERSKVSLITVGDCACDEIETNFEVDCKEWFGWQPRMLVLELQQKNLGWEFREQKLQKMGLERHFGVKGLVEFGRTKFENSYNVCEKRSAVFVVVCFHVPWGELVQAVEVVVLLVVERRALSGHNEQWSLFGSLYL